MQKPSWWPGRVPDSFKLVLEYGRDSSLKQAAPQLPSGQVALPLPLATVEFEFTNDEGAASVLERFAQAKTRVAFDRLEERVVLKLVAEPDEPQKGLKVKLSTACVSPALRCVQVARTSSTGAVPEALLTALLKHCDLSGVWKLRGAEGFGNFWCSCCEVRSWRSLANMNLSGCGLTSLPAAVGALPSLRILRLSHNRLTALPPELSALTALEVLAADHNLLTAIPAELRRCSALRHLELEGNRLATPVLDLRALSCLVSLQLFGNPLEYLPELSPATALRSLSLANVRIMADAAYSRWEVEVAALPSFSRVHKLTPLFKLTFRRSSCQHPLLAGALGRISEDRSNCLVMAGEETALQQLVLMALSEQPVVAEQACRTLGALAQLDLLTAKKLLAHDVASTITTLLRSPRHASKLCGLSLLGSIAAASDAISAELLTPELLSLLAGCIRAAEPDPRVAALTALASLAFCRENKLKIRAAEGLLATLVELATGQQQQHNHHHTAGAAASGTAAAAAAAAAAVLDGDGGSSAAGTSASAAAPASRVQSPSGKPLEQPSQQLQSAAAYISPANSVPTAPAATATAAAPASAPASGRQTVVRITQRPSGSHRHSDTGAVGSPIDSGAAAFSALVGSPPDPSSQFTSSHALKLTPGGASSVSAGGALGTGHAGGMLPAAAASAAATLPTATGGGGGASTAGGEVLSPPHQTRALHHSASTPAAVSLATATSVGGSGVGSLAATAAAAARTLSPMRGTVMTPGGVTSPGAEAGTAAAAAGGLPPQIALAPPRAVPEPVAARDQARLLAIKVLAILGENEVVRRAVGAPPIAGRGIRVLALDGGGMRGLALVQMMRHIERRVGRPLHVLFDLVVGTSTGAIVAVGLGLFQFSLEQCEAIYTGLGHKVFNQSASTGAAGPTPREELLAAAQAQAAAQAAGSASGGGGAGGGGGGGSGWRDSIARYVRGTSNNLRVAVYGFKHDASTFEELLRQMCDIRKLGCVGNQLIDAAALGGPKVAAVATMVSVCPVTPFLFTSYELPAEAAPAAAAMRACPSSCRHLIWQAVRASSAAPYYLDDFVCGDDRYQDGAATANNPAILALQQARLLWPGAHLEALVSLGCGTAPPSRRERGAHAVLDTGAVLVDAATSPDRADEALCTLAPLVPGLRYFRFQPVHERCAMELDDVDPAHWAALQAAVDEYCTAHAARLDELAELLLSGQPRDQEEADEAGPGAADGAEAGEEAGAADAEAAEAEDPYEGPVVLGPDGTPLPRVPRIRLEDSRRGVLLVEAPCTPTCWEPGAAGCGLTGHPTPTLTSASTSAAAEQAVLEALAQQPHALRRFDIAATAADAAASAALVAAHLRRREELQRQREMEMEMAEEVEAAQGRGGQGQGALQPASSLQRDTPPRYVEDAAMASLKAAAAPAAAGVANAPERSAPATPVGPQYAASGSLPLTASLEALDTRTLSPPRAGPALVSPRSSLRPWAAAPAASGRPAASTGGALGSGPSGVAAAADGAVTPVVEVAAASAAVADASVEAAAAAAGSAPSPSSLFDYFFGGSSAAGAARRGSGASAGGAASPPDAAAAGVTSPPVETRGTASPPAFSIGTASTPATAAATTAAHTPSRTDSPIPDGPFSAAAATASRASFALRVRSPSLSAGGAAPSTPSALAPSSGITGRAVSASSSIAAAAAAAAAATAGKASPAPSTVPAVAAVASGADAAAGGGSGGAAASGDHLRPSTLLAALLEDLRDRCGVLHLGLTPLLRDGGSGGGRSECGLVAGWRREVVAVVEPGPDADRIRADLGPAPSGTGGAPSLTSLFAASRGAPLESPSRCTYTLLARQEVWHLGAPLATLLLQVSRPAAVLQPEELAAMAPQLGGLLVTAAAPLPPPIVSALLRAGVRAVVCPRAPLAPPPLAPPPLPPSTLPHQSTPPPQQQQQSSPQVLVPRASISFGGASPWIPPSPSPSASPSPSPAAATSAFATPASAAAGHAASRALAPVAYAPRSPLGPMGSAIETEEPDGAAAGATASAPQAVALAVGPEEVAGFFEVMVGQLVAGATVLGAIAAAEQQHEALRDCMAVHHTL